jgi:hypothetical protein
MKTWYRPSFCGDFRLEATGERSCVLVAENPTPSEVKILGVLLKGARASGWCSDVQGISLVGKSEVPLMASVDVVGRGIFAGGGEPLGVVGPVLITAFSEGGKITSVWDTTEEKQLPDAPKKGGKAVTTRKPRRGRSTGDCPESLASEVLQAFSTPEQWAQWECGGAMIIHGGLTGRRYRLAHRKRHVQTGNQVAVAVGLDDRDRYNYGSMPAPVLAFDWMLPPPEEVLSIKLVLEHREHWLRNKGSMPSAEQELFADPFPGEVEATDLEVDRLWYFEGMMRGFLQGASMVSPLLGEAWKIRRERR